MTHWLLTSLHFGFLLSLGAVIRREPKWERHFEQPTPAPKDDTVMILVTIKMPVTMRPSLRGLAAQRPADSKCSVNPRCLCSGLRTTSKFSKPLTPVLHTHTRCCLPHRFHPRGKRMICFSILSHWVRKQGFAVENHSIGFSLLSFSK